MKWIVALVIIVLIGGGAWWYLRGTPSPQTATTQQQATTTAQTPPPTDGMSAANDASDAAIEQDTAAVDAQMQGLSTDSANVNSSLNDQPGSVTY